MCKIKVLELAIISPDKFSRSLYAFCSYFNTNQLTDKSDVYSFGIVLLELICGRAPFNPALPEDQRKLDQWVGLSFSEATSDIPNNWHLHQYTSLKAFTEESLFEIWWLGFRVNEISGSDSFMYPQSTITWDIPNDPLLLAFLD